MENGKWKMKTTGGPIGSVDHCGIAEKRRKKAKKELCSREGAKTQREKSWQYSVGSWRKDGVRLEVDQKGSS